MCIKIDKVVPATLSLYISTNSMVFNYNFYCIIISYTITWLNG